MSTVPNPIGVTAIAAVNGPGSYAERYAATRRLLSAKGSKMRRRLRRNKRTLSHKQRAALAKGRRALAAKRAGHATPKRRRHRKGGKPRVFGGHFRAVSVRIGPKRRKSYAYLTKRRHKLRHVPDYAIMGYRSPKDAIKRGMTARGAAAYLKRKDRLKARREKAAAKISARILAGKFPLTPNRRHRRRRAGHVVTFRNWESSMLANARRKKARKKSRSRRRHRKATPAQLRALAHARAVRRRKHRGGKRRSYRRNPLMQAAANPRRRRRHVRRRRHRRNPLMQAAANRRRRRRVHRRRHHRNPLMQAAANRRRRRHHRRHYASNRRRHRRVFRRNAILSGLTDVLKQGGIAAIGLVGQKALTRFLASKIGTMLPASLQPYANSISALLVALPAVFVAGKVLPGSSKLIGVGVGAGAVHTIAVDVAKALGQQSAADFLGDYTNAQYHSPYAGYGSYYQFSPGQQYAGMGGGYGEYFTTGTSGFGAYGAAGAGPQLTQAAAGEYIVAGAQGIGEYEQVTPEYSTPEQIREGISPDLHSAERALSIAEAAAGVGVYNGMGAAGSPTVGLQSTVYPQGGADAIPDQPGGSRAGVFCGENGVFGPCG